MSLFLLDPNISIRFTRTLGCSNIVEFTFDTQKMSNYRHFCSNMAVIKI